MQASTAKRQLPPLQQSEHAFVATHLFSGSMRASFKDMSESSATLRPALPLWSLGPT